jgi:molybdate transport system substrate-binding protein
MREVGISTLSAVAALTLALAPTKLCAAEIKGLFAAGVGIVTRELTPEFERSSGHKVAVTYQVIGALKDRLARGEIADIFIATPADLVDLEKAREDCSG